MSYTISVFDDPNRIPELIELFRTGLGDTTVEHWKWRLFTENGLDDKPFAVIAEDKNGKLLGVSTVIPVYYGPRKIKAILFGDWVVHPDARGQGIIRKIFDYIYGYANQNNFSFMITFPNQNSYPILKKYGFTNLEGVSVWNSANHLIYSSNKRECVVDSGIEYRFHHSCPLEEEFRQVDGRIYRSNVFMHWKYDLNPDEKYTWLTLWNGQNCKGYFVYQLTKGRFRTAVNVYDWEYNDDDPLPFQKAVALLYKQGNFVSFWGKYSDSIKKLFATVGLQNGNRAVVCIVKPLCKNGIPDSLSLTRIDTDY